MSVVSDPHLQIVLRSNPKTVFTAKAIIIQIILFFTIVLKKFLKIIIYFETSFLMGFFYNYYKIIDKIFFLELI